MMTKTVEAVLDMPAAVNEVEQAQAALHKAQETESALVAERKAIHERQAQLTSREAAEFYTLDKRLGEIAREVHIAKMEVVHAKLTLLDARTSQAKRVITEQHPLMVAQERIVQAERQKLVAITEPMRQAQIVLESHGGDRGTLNRMLDNLEAEWHRMLIVDAAPVVRSLQHQPRG